MREFIQKIKKLFIKTPFLVGVLVASIISQFAFANGKVNLPNLDNIPGGVVVIPILHGSDSKLDNKPTVSYNGKKVTVFSKDEVQGIKAENARWFAVVAIPIQALKKTRKETLKIIFKQGSKRIKKKQYFTIVPHKYKVQRFKLPMSTKYTKKQLSKISRDSKEMRNALLTWSTPELSSGEVWVLDAPIKKGRISSTYGSSRLYVDDGIYRFHKGIDIAHPDGTPVHSAGYGKVVLAKHLFLTGNMVIVDHGYGLMTMYVHMSKILVKKGQEVKRGQLVGKVGTTGRSTGPHLHLGVSINGKRVQPTLFIPQMSHW